MKDINSFHLRPITLICDHSEVFYKQKKRSKKDQNGAEIYKNCNLQYYQYILDIFLINTVKEYYNLSSETNYTDL